MSESTSEAASCPSCGKKYRWKSELIGKKVRCGCGQAMRMPEAPGVAVALGNGSTKATAKPASEDAYTLSDPDATPGSAAAAPPPATGKCPNCGQKLKPLAVICLNCGFNVQSGTKLTTAVVAADDDAPDAPAADRTSEVLAALNKRSSGAAKELASRLAVAAKRADEDARQRKQMERKAFITNIVVPLIMLPVGVFFVFLGSYYLVCEMNGGTLLEAIIGGVIVIGVEVVVMVPLLLAGVYISASLLQISFGNLGTALIKLVAICAGPAVIGDFLLILLLPFMGISFYAPAALMVALSLIFIGIPMKMMFDLEGSEVIQSVMIITALRIVAVLFFFFGVLALFHP